MSDTFISLLSWIFETFIYRLDTESHLQQNYMQLVLKMLLQTISSKSI